MCAGRAFYVPGLRETPAGGGGGDGGGGEPEAILHTHTVGGYIVAMMMKSMM